MPTRRPLMLPTRFPTSAAVAAAPAPSAIRCSASTRPAIAAARSASLTVTMRSTSRWMKAKVIVSGSGLPPRPSASVDAGDDLDEPAGAHALLKRVRHVELDADHLAARVDRLGDRRHPADQAAAADRHDERVDAGIVLEHLERDRRGAGDHVGDRCTAR